VQGAGQGDDGPGHRRLLGPAGHAVDERLVDLEGVDGEAAQVGQGRVAGAEVVDGQVHAERLELVQADDGHLQVVHQDALGDLQGQALGGEAGVAEGRGHVVGQVAAEQVMGGEVDVQQQRAGVGVPAGHLAAGLAQHEPVELDHQAGLLGQGDELGRRDQPAVRPRPAHQGLGAGDATGVQVDDRLVVDHQLPALDRTLQGGVHVVAVAHRAQHGALEHLVDALAAALGDVHGDVGVAQQLGLVDGLALVEGDADAGADGDLPADQGERRAQGGQDPLGEHPRRLEIRVLGQDGELVAAQPADGVVLAQAAAQPGPDLAQQPVPGAVTQAVVDHLEVVQVDEEHGHAAAVAARPGQRVPDPVVEQRPVGQVGEAVVERQVLELGRQGVALAQRGPQHALGAAQLAHGGLVLADQVGHPDQHQQEQQGAAGHDHRDVQALVAQRLDGQDGRGHQRRPGQREQPGPGQPGPRGRDRVGEGGHRGLEHGRPHRA
jgi:hypothetical protein